MHIQGPGEVGHLVHSAQTVPHSQHVVVPLVLQSLASHSPVTTRVQLLQVLHSSNGSCVETKQSGFWQAPKLSAVCALASDQAHKTMTDDTLSPFQLSTPANPSTEPPLGTWYLWEAMVAKGTPCPATAATAATCSGVIGTPPFSWIVDMCSQACGTAAACRMSWSGLGAVWPLTVPR